MTNTAEYRATRPSRLKALQLLREHPDGLTSYDAMRWGQRKLDSYVSDLITGGYNIEKVKITQNGHSTIRYIYKG